MKANGYRGRDRNGRRVERVVKRRTCGSFTGLRMCEAAEEDDIRVLNLRQRRWCLSEERKIEARQAVEATVAFGSSRTAPSLFSFGTDVLATPLQNKHQIPCSTHRSNTMPNPTWRSPGIGSTMPCWP